MSLFETVLEANKKGIEVRINPFLIENKGIEELNKLRISLMKGNMPKSLWTNGEFNPKSIAPEHLEESICVMIETLSKEINKNQ